MCVCVQAVLSWRFHSAVRFLRGLSVWEGLLSRSVLLQLELSQLVSQQLQPYLRAAISDAAAQPQLAVSRVEAVAAALPAAWFAGTCSQTHTVLLTGGHASHLVAVSP